MISTRLVLCLALLAGCGGSASTSSPPQAPLDPAAREALLGIGGLIGQVGFRTNQLGGAGVGPSAAPAGGGFSKGLFTPTAGAADGVCPRGGSLSASERQVDARTVETTEVFTNCTRESRDWSDAVRIANGTRVLQIADSGYTGTTPLADARDRRLFNPDRYRSTTLPGFSEKETAGSDVLYESTSEGTAEFTIDPQSLAMVDKANAAGYFTAVTGTWTSNGRTVLVSVGAKRNDPADDIHTEAVSRLRSEQSASEYDALGLPHRLSVVLDGEERLVDKRHPERSSGGIYHQLRVEDTGPLIAGGGVITRRISGGFTPSCLTGRVTVQTLAPLELASSGSLLCPTAGSLRLSLPSGLVAQVTYDAQDMMIDIDGDGVVDVRRPRCSDVLGTAC